MIAQPLRLALCALALFTLAGCGGRAHIGENAGRNWKQLWRAQAESKPQDRLASMAAADAKGAMSNHAKRNGIKTGTSRSGGMSIGGGGGGGLTPSTSEYSPVSSDGKIHL